MNGVDHEHVPRFGEEEEKGGSFLHREQELPESSHSRSVQTVDDLVKALTDTLSPYSAINIRGFSTLHGLSQLTASCDAFIAANFSKMLNMSERELISLPRIQVNVDVSEHTEDIWSSDVSVLERIMPSVVSQLAQLFRSASPSRQLRLEERLISMELLSDLSVQVVDSTKSKKQLSPSQSPEKPASEYISLMKKQPSPIRRLDLGSTENLKDSLSLKTRNTSDWEILATHSVMGMGAMSVVRHCNDLLLLNIQMVTKGSDSDLACPISPTTGIPLAVNDAFISQMEQSRSGFGIVSLDDSLMSVGGFDRSGVLKSAERFNHCANAWVRTGDLSCPRARMAVLRHKDKIYAIGGSNGKSELNTVDVLGISKDGNGCSLIGNWRPCTSTLTTARSDFGAAVLDDHIYAVGGTHYSKILRSVEVFNIAEQQWKQVAPMATPRKGAAIVSCNGSIYAIGGQSSSWGCLKSVECYDPASNKWRFVASLPTPRRNACAVTIEDRIYIIGGYTGSDAVNSMEVYDPASDEWTTGERMVLKRSSAAAILFQDAIYVVGGFSGSIFLNSVERYDIDSEQWTSYFSSS